MNSTAQDSPPDVLYHYTSQSGLLGILQDECVWATKIHYLNDHSEFQLALDMATAVLEDLLASDTDQTRKRRIECLLNNLPSIRLLNVCVASFSADGDSLSQWRAYSKDVGGYAIGFDSAALLAKAREQGFALVRCEYDEEKQRALVRRLVEESLSQDFNMVPGYEDPERPRTFVVLKTGGDFTENLAKLAPLIKNRAFQEEKEWRLVSTRGITNERLSFRPGRSMLTPYFRFLLGSEVSNYLRSIVVGPTPHLELAEMATKSLMSQWPSRVKVESSKAPYRNW